MWLKKVLRYNMNTKYKIRVKNGANFFVIEYTLEIHDKNTSKTLITQNFFNNIISAQM